MSRTIDAGIADQTSETTASSFYQKPLVWPMDTIDLEQSTKGKHSCKQIFHLGYSLFFTVLFVHLCKLISF
jgi:hypothetical protein